MNMINLRSGLVVIVALSILSGCASGPPNVNNPSTGDLLFRWDKLNDYLESRRTELDGLQAQLVKANDTLKGFLISLGDVEAEVSRLRLTARASDNEIAMLASDLAATQQLAKSTRAQLAQIERQKEIMESRSFSSLRDAQGDEQSVSNIKMELVSMQRQVDVLSGAVARLTESKRRAVLRSQQVSPTRPATGARRKRP